MKLSSISSTFFLSAKSSQTEVASEMQDQSSNEEWFCLSFSNYSSHDHQIADIATRVISQEIQSLHDAAAGRINNIDNHLQREISGIHDDDFQFVLLPPIADHIDLFTMKRSTEGGDYPVNCLYPIFNRDLLLSCGFDNEKEEEADAINSVRLPLKKLFSDQGHRDLFSSSSSSESEADELEEIPHEITFCIHPTPKSPPPSTTADSTSPAGRCKQSNPTVSLSSTSSWKQKLRRWRRDLLRIRRRSSDGNESLVFLQNPNNKHEDGLEKNKVRKEVKSKEKSLSALEVVYARNKALKEREKKKKKKKKKKRTYLPYRQDHFGGVYVFANGSGLGSRNAFAPFSSLVSLFFLFCSSF